VTDIHSNFNILMAMTRLEPMLPTLFNNVWNDIKLQLETDLEALRNSKDDDEQERLADQLSDTMNRFPESQERLQKELYIQYILKQVIADSSKALMEKLNIEEETLKASLDVALYSSRWAIDSEDLPSIEDISPRAITISTGGLEKIKSIKFRNLHLDFVEISMILSAALLAGHNAVKEASGFVVAAGVLLTIAMLGKAATVEISEQDASVFWGFIQARVMNNRASESAIIYLTNSERAKYKRSPLSVDDIQRSLINLQSMKCIARVKGHPDIWEIIEQFQIKM
jgi:hypothetical protein